MGNLISSNLKTSVTKNPITELEKCLNLVFGSFAELKLKNNVKSQNFLKVIMALETLFMEWSCNQRVQESLIRVGTVYVLFQQLQLLQRLIDVDKMMKKV